jgi:IS30 family transposase
MTEFKQLTIEERYHIQAHLEQGLSLRKIAEKLGRAASTLSRELRRNLHPSCKYLAQMAQNKTDQR